MQLKADRFDDFHLYGASAPEWNQRYLQISCGTMQSSLVEVTLGRAHLFRKVLSHRVVQQGSLPYGKICFVIPAHRTEPGRMQGREFSDRSLFVLRGGQEFVLHRPDRMELLALTFDESLFDRHIDTQPGAARLRRALGSGVLDVSPVGLARLRSELEAMFIADAPILGGQVLPPSSAVALEQLILGAVMDALRDGRGHRDRNRGMTAHALVNACHRLTLDNLDAPPSVAELCTRLGTSRRTIQDSFQKIAQTTSLSYLRALRLNLVRQALHRTLPAQADVGELATHRGFSQLSHFAQQYKSLFGELPSQTLRADALAARP